MADKEVQIFVKPRPSEEDSCFHIENETSITVSGNTYVFNKVFQANTSQEDIYTNVVQDVLINVMNGYNSTIFVYGQTASGKTYVMEGNMEDEEKNGLIPRAAKGIFQGIQEFEKNVSFSVNVNYFEIYNERVIDLLAGNKCSDVQLKVYESTKVAPFISGLKNVLVANVEELLEEFQRGRNLIVMGATSKNERSSRSHVIFQVVIEQENVETGQQLSGKLLLVDLAGSEKVTSDDSKLLNESKNINKSLSTLSHVICALAQGKKHIPYRDSLLTRLLKESLGGNCCTAIILCLNPSAEAQTRQTLDFGTRAQTIKNKFQVNKKYDEATKWKMLFKNEKEKEKIKNQFIKDMVEELNKWRNGDSVPKEEWTNLSGDVNFLLMDRTTVNETVTDISIENCDMKEKPPQEKITKYEKQQEECESLNLKTKELMSESIAVNEETLKLEEENTRLKNAEIANTIKWVEENTKVQKQNDDLIHLSLKLQSKSKKNSELLKHVNEKSPAKLNAVKVMISERDEEHARLRKENKELDKLSMQLQGNCNENESLKLNVDELWTILNAEKTKTLQRDEENAGLRKENEDLNELSMKFQGKCNRNEFLKLNIEELCTSLNAEKERTLERDEEIARLKEEKNELVEKSTKLQEKCNESELLAQHNYEIATKLGAEKAKAIERDEENKYLIESARKLQEKCNESELLKQLIEEISEKLGAVKENALEWNEEITRLKEENLDLVESSKQLQEECKENELLKQNIEALSAKLDAEKAKALQRNEENARLKKENDDFVIESESLKLNIEELLAKSNAEKAKTFEQEKENGRLRNKILYLQSRFHKVLFIIEQCKRKSEIAFEGKMIEKLKNLHDETLLSIREEVMAALTGRQEL